MSSEREYTPEQMEFARRRWADLVHAYDDLAGRDEGGGEEDEEDALQRVELAEADLEEMGIDPSNRPAWLRFPVPWKTKG